MSVLTIPGHTLLTTTRGLVGDDKPLVSPDECSAANSDKVGLLAVWPSCQSANLLDRIHEQKLADGVVGLRNPPMVWPVVLAAHLSQDAVLSLRPPG
jgi:hypothetical protein